MDSLKESLLHGDLHLTPHPSPLLSSGPRSGQRQAELREREGGGGEFGSLPLLWLLLLLISPSGSHSVSLVICPLPCPLESNLKTHPLDLLLDLSEQSRVPQSASPKQNSCSLTLFTHGSFSGFPVCRQENQLRVFSTT